MVFSTFAIISLWCSVLSGVHAGLNWGIVGPGRIAHEFTVSLKLSQRSVVAVAAGSAAEPLERAKNFAEVFDIPKYYGTYQGIAQDPTVDIVYIATTNDLHYPNAMMMLQHGKHVLLEKPTAMNSGQHRHLLEIAAEKGVFFMTNYWTRFFPAFMWARELINNHTIGDVLLTRGDMAFQAVNNPADRFLNPASGGGALMDMGCYQVSFATLFSADAGQLGRPDQVTAAGVMTKTGVDVSSSHEFMWNRDHLGLPPSASSFTTSFARPSAFETEVIGTKGRVIIRAPTNCPTDIDVEIFSEPLITPQPCCGQALVDRKKFHEPIPEYPAKYLPAQYPGGTGFVYVIAAVEKGIAAGLTSLPEISNEEQLLISELTEELIKKVKASSRMLSAKHAMPIPAGVANPKTGFSLLQAMGSARIGAELAAYDTGATHGWGRMLACLTFGALLGAAINSWAHGVSPKFWRYNKLRGEDRPPLSSDPGSAYNTF